MVSEYSTIDCTDAEIGEYKLSESSDEIACTYNISIYKQYTVQATEIADVYLDGSQIGEAITVTSNGES